MSKKKTALAVHHNVSKKEERMNKASWKKQRAREARNYESAEEKKFADSLRNDGFQINIMDGDGNCLFRSISDQLYGDFARHMEIRQNIMDYILQNESHFRLFMEDDEPFEEYMSRMRSNGEWGGNQELYAASQIFNTTIYVHQLDSPRFVLTAENSPKTIHLSYHGEYHYNSLRSLSSGGSISEVPPVETHAPSSTFISQTAAKEAIVSSAVRWVSMETVQYALKLTDFDVNLAIEMLMTDSEDTIRSIYYATTNDDNGGNDSCDIYRDSRAETVETSSIISNKSNGVSITKKGKSNVNVNADIHMEKGQGKDKHTRSTSNQQQQDRAISKKDKRKLKKEPLANSQKNASRDDDKNANKRGDEILI